MNVNAKRLLLAGSTVIAVSATAAPLAPAAAAPPATPTCSAVPDGATFIATSASGVTVDRTGTAEALPLPFVAMPQITMRGPDGTIWSQAIAEGTPELHRVGVDGSSTLIGSGEVALKSAGWFDGRSAAAWVDYSGDFVRPGDVESSGAVWVEFADGASHLDFGPAEGPEYGVASANIGAGRLVQGGWSDLAEWFAFADSNAQELTDWFDPTANAPYNSPPLFQVPIASSDADGAQLTWVEGPDWDGATNEIVGGWTLVVADAVTGAESLRLDLGDAGVGLTHADFDGRFWVGTFDTTQEPAPDDEYPADHVLVVDTQASTPVAVDAGCPAGVTATLDRLGTPEPAVPQPAPTTTAAPPTTAGPTTTTPVTTTPGQCGEYVEVDNDYPIQRCEQGDVVLNVQAWLFYNGSDIAGDGYFGPATESAVRDFQEGHGLEADGLVGPDTWAALIAEYPPVGSDANNNGTVDPWEVSWDSAGGSREPRTPSVEFSPANPLPGGTIEVTGSGCDPGEDVVVWTQGDIGTGEAFEYPVTLPTTADDSGSVVAATTISDMLAPGDGFTVALICGGMPPTPENVASVEGTVGA